MKIGILTSSRADYGIYYSLIEGLKSQHAIELICFGTHLSEKHGYTINNINGNGISRIHKVDTYIEDDSAYGISRSYSLTSEKFTVFWNTNHFDLVFCLGDRFEMAAAVLAGVPYLVPFAHLHGGETTLGAIDNIYRHSISLASNYHFTATEGAKVRLENILDNQNNIHNVGSISLDGIHNMDLLSKQGFEKKWSINLDVPPILITVHPETVAFEKNKLFAQIFGEALSELQKDYNLVITLPNADTEGQVYRELFHKLKEKFKTRIDLIENFGKQSYFTCMKYAGLLLGNTSSGIIEAASFKKYVVNVGNRQLGRECSENITHVSFNAKKIIEAVNQNFGKKYNGKNIYFSGNAVQRIIEVLKEIEQ